MWIGSSNHEEIVFPDAEKFDISRKLAPLRIVSLRSVHSILAYIADKSALSLFQLYYLSSKQVTTND